MPFHLKISKCSHKYNFPISSEASQNIVNVDRDHLVFI